MIGNIILFIKTHFKKTFCEHEYYFIPYERNVSDYCCRKCGKVKRF